MSALKGESARAFLSGWVEVKPKPGFPPEPHKPEEAKAAEVPPLTGALPVPEHNSNLGPEMACGPDGKEDAAIHEPILDNPAADKAFRDAAVLRTMDRGMSLEDALSLYGNTEANQS